MTTEDKKAPAQQPRPSRSKRACPVCGKPRSEAYDPFCSKRCADVDLHRWLKGSYVIPGAKAEPDPGDEGGND
ncbi:MAG: DNA gyrase inhibitor YacG [Roseiarcus sp.]